MNWVTKRADGLQQFLPENKATFFISVASLQAALELFFPANVISPEACRMAERASRLALLQLKCSTNPF
jgi:hypothetical protein